MKSTIDKVLSALHKDAQKDYMRIGRGVVSSIFRPLQPSDFKNAYLPISENQGVTIRDLVQKHQCKTVVEFGTSFGISTIYLADAVRENGGKVITTELIESKAIQAKRNIEKAGLEQHVEVRVGDAMETLKDFKEPIDFLFLDGWKDLYLPLFKMLEPLLYEATLIYADNMDMEGTQQYGAYVRSQSQRYTSSMLDGGKAMLTKVAA